MVALEVTNHGIGTDVFTSFWLVNLFTSLTKIRYGSNCLLTVTPMKVCLVLFSSFPCLTFPISWFPTRRIICMSVTWMFVILYIFFDFINAAYFSRQNEWILFFIYIYNSNLRTIILVGSLRLCHWIIFVQHENKHGGLNLLISSY